MMDMHTTEFNNVIQLKYLINESLTDGAIAERASDNRETDNKAFLVKSKLLYVSHG